MVKITSFSWLGRQVGSRRGFTIIEILTVISIIALLSSVVLASLSNARQPAKVARAVILLKEVHKAVELYHSDTGRYPPFDCMTGYTGLPIRPTGDHECTAGDDPFLNSLGIPGWNGPYISIWNLTHPWGGHIGVEMGGDNPKNRDSDNDGIEDYFIFLDDDLIGMGGAGNGGKIPPESMTKIDKILDDGNLRTGIVRGSILGKVVVFTRQTTSEGEMAIFHEDTR